MAGKSKKGNQESAVTTNKPVIDKNKKIKSMQEALNKKYGPNTVMQASSAEAIEKMTPKFVKVPSREVRIALNCEGFTKIVEIYGPNSAGKTKFAIETITCNQKEDPNFWTAWIETEDSIQVSDLLDMGVDMTRVIYVSQDECGSAERVMDIIRTILEDDAIDFVVVNSIAGLCPKDEISNDLDKNNIGLIARLLSKFFRVSIGFIGKNKKTIMFINQTRTNIGQMFGDPMQSTGGVALGFYASQRIKFTRLSIQKDDPIDKEDGVKIKADVTKNRLSGKKNPYKSATYYAKFDKGIDSVIPIPDCLKEKGIMTLSGAWWYYPSKENVQTVAGVECKFSSRKNLLDVLYTNEEFFNYFLDLIDENDLVSNATDEDLEAIRKEEEELAKFAAIDESVRMEEENGADQEQFNE